MTNNSSNKEARTEALKNESTRQRWELFHRAIAFAKENNVSALDDKDDGANAPREIPLQSVNS